MTFCSGLLETRMCRYAEQQGQLRAIGGQSFTDAGQSGTTGIYRATALNVGGNKLVNPVFQEAKFNCVGLFYLSRFNVTLDFPNKSTLTPGKRSDKTDGRNLGGMDLVQKDGKIVIDSVNIESPAEKAGLHVDDEIVSLGDLDASRSRTYELQYKMSQPGSVQVIARRGEKQFKTTIELK